MAYGRTHHGDKSPYNGSGEPRKLNPFPVQGSSDVTQFEMFATAVTEKVFELLQPPVLAADSNGRILASSQFQWQGLHLDTLAVIQLPPPRHIPLSLDGAGGQLLIYQQAQDETAVYLTKRIVQLIMDQTLLLEHLPSYHKLKVKFLYNVLYGLLSDETIIELQAQQLGLDLTSPRTVILIDASNYIMLNTTEPPRPALPRPALAL